MPLSLRKTSGSISNFFTSPLMLELCARLLMPAADLILKCPSIYISKKQRGVERRDAACPSPHFLLWLCSGGSRRPSTATTFLRGGVWPWQRPLGQNWKALYERAL